MRPWGITCFPPGRCCGCCTTTRPRRPATTISAATFFPSWPENQRCTPTIFKPTGYPDPPAKFTFDDENRRGQAIDSIVSGGCILSGGTVRNSVLGRGVRVHAGAAVESCVILDNCDIGRRAKLRRV